MTDDSAQRFVPPIEFISGGRVRVEMDAEQVLSFQDWQRLSKEERDSLIWMAENHPSIMRIVRMEIWMGQTGSLLFKAFSVAAVIIGVLLSARQLGVF